MLSFPSKLCIIAPDPANPILIDVFLYHNMVSDPVFRLSNIFQFEFLLIVGLETFGYL